MSAEIHASSSVREKLTSRLYRFRFLLLLGLLDAAGPLGIDMYLPAFPQIESELHAGGGAMQLTLSLFLAGLGIGQLICGPISDRLGRRGPLIVGCVLFGLASAVCALTRSIESLIAARFLMGLAGATGMVVARAVVRDCFEERDSAKVYSMLMLVISIAPILSPSVGSWLMGLGSWPFIFWALALFGGMCAIAVSIDLPETHPVEARRNESPAGIIRQYMRMLVDVKFMTYALPASLALGELFAYVAYAPTLFMDVYQLSSGAFSLLFAVNAIGLIGSAQFNQFLLNRWGTHALVQATAVLNLCGVMLLMLLAWTGFGGFPLFFVTLFLSMSCLGVLMPNAAAAVMGPFGDQAGAASALLGMLQFAAGATTGALVGIFADGTSLPMVMTMCICALGTVGVVCSMRQGRSVPTNDSTEASGSAVAACDAVSH